MSGEDSDIAGEVAAILRHDGIEILLETSTEAVSAIGTNVRLSIRVRGESRELEGSHLLVATGRRPNTNALNVPAAGIVTDERGYI